MTDITIRRATASDATGIARIYNHYILSSTATFDTEPKSVEERAEWIADRDPAHPVFVSERDGAIVAWGALGPYRARRAWGQTAEVAVYVADGMTGMGLGPRMLGALIEAAGSAGLHVLVSQIVSENEASIRMTSRAGFSEVGTLREVGRKFDRWLDVVIMQLTVEGGGRP